jgi:HK97 family phage major capsid protein
MELADLTRSQLAKAKVADFVRFVACLYMQGGDPFGAAKQFAQRWPLAIHNDLIQKSVFAQKSAVVAATGAAGNWGEALMPDELAAAFVAYVRPLTLIGRLPALRRVPFNVPIIQTTTGASGFAWTTGGRGKPIVSAALQRSTLRPATAAGIVVTSKELLRLAAPGSQEALRDDLANGLAAFLDSAFVDPAAAGVTDVSPASITYGVSAAASSTGDPHEDLRALLRAFATAGGDLAQAVILLSSENASALALRSGSTDSPTFQAMTVSGGVLAGVPALASSSVGNQLVIVDSARILVADNDGLDVRIAEHASLEMDSDPTQNSGGTGSPLAPVATATVSLWQTDSAAIKIERSINWSRIGAIAIVDGANYLSEGGSPA